MMFDSLITVSLTVATISAGIMAGVYFAFSAFIMRAFNQLGPVKATDAMNAINEVILHSWFMLLFFGSTLVYFVLFVAAIVNDDMTGRWWVLSAGLIYVFGMFILTAAFNVPLNNRLAKVQDYDTMKPELWALYFKYWTRWNHVRGVCSLIAMMLSMYSLVLS